MKNRALPAILALFIAFSLPAVAGPNWDVIHRAEANKAAHIREKALVLPLDYGPRAITTPWLNRERIGELVSQADTESKLARASGRKGHVVVAAHTHHNLPTHS
ncbi:MAG TPA: hypothetical protein VKC56_12360 [Gallionellaceae bacterium]|nr:hypothetical protein [Gallionellaceae bacterium]